MSSNSKSRRAAHAAKVAARSAYASGAIKCYVEFVELPDGTPDLQLREKATRRRVRVLAAEPFMQQVAPLSNLLLDCYGHGGGLVKSHGGKELISISASIVKQNAREIAVSLDEDFSVAVKILTTKIALPPHSVWCYIEEYPVGDEGLGVRLRQKETGRKVEMYGKSKEHLARFLASPKFTGAAREMPNLYEKDGFDDYVLVSGGTAVDSYDVLRFNDGDDLSYLLGPTPDTAYRDAFRALKDEEATAAHARTARSHLEHGHYREAVLSARLAVELACGGRSGDIKPRLAGAPQDVSRAGDVLWERRNAAVHEGDTRVEQQDAQEAVDAMSRILEYLNNP